MKRHAIEVFGLTTVLFLLFFHNDDGSWLRALLIALPSSVAIILLKIPISQHIKALIAKILNKPS